MFETIRIKIFGKQPAAKVTDRKLERLIQREFGHRISEVRQKLQRVTSDTNNGKNRISAAILKLANKDFNVLDHYIAMNNSDFRDVISQAEYPRCSKLDFGEMEERNMKHIYLEDWIEYSNWLNKT
jgi:uncharacterized protein YgbK (DUF1537 family)